MFYYWENGDLEARKYLAFQYLQQQKSPHGELIGILPYIFWVFQVLITLFILSFNNSLLALSVL